MTGRIGSRHARLSPTPRTASFVKPAEPRAHRQAGSHLFTQPTAD
jgi:hypothetical protein